MSTSVRGFSVAHQRVHVDVDIVKKRLKGWTELTIVPTTLALQDVVLDARRIKVEKCYVNGIETSFEHTDLLSSPPSRPRAWGVYQYALYKEKLQPLLKDDGSGPGELVIGIPPSVKIKEPDESTFIASHSTKEKTYEPLTVRVWYHLDGDEGNEGLHFVKTGTKEAHVYTTHTPIGQATSCWLPCVDGLWSLSTWEMEFTVPQLLDDDDPDSEVTMLCNNVTPNEAPDPLGNKRKVVKFDAFSPVSSQHIGFAIGPFKQVILSTADEKSSGDRPDGIDVSRTNNGAETQSLAISAYAVASKVEMAAHTCRMVRRSIDFFSREFGSFPYGSYTICFVADLPTQTMTTIDACALTICSDTSLFSPDTIEPLFTESEVLVRGVAAQWCGVNIVPQRWNDLWVTEGIALFMTHLFLRKVMGRNEYRFRIRKANDKLCEEDIGRPPIGRPQFRYPLCPEDLSFIRLKAPLVLYILDRRMTKTDRSLGISRVLSKLFLQSMSGDLRSQLSTVHFQRQCEKVAHHRLVRFFEEWVFSSGFPIFRVTQRFNKKRMFIEMGIGQVHSRELPDEVLKSDEFLDRAITHLEIAKKRGRESDTLKQSQFVAKQETPIPGAVVPEEPLTPGQEENMRLMREVAGGDSNGADLGLDGSGGTAPDFPVPISFSGPMTIRIHEADGTPYEHVVELRDTFTKLDIQYNTKYKRLRRKEKFRRANQGNTGDEKFISCLGDVLMSDSEVSSWQLVDWGDAEEDEGMFNEAFEWLRVDADFEWLGKFFVGQPDYMYASQLQQDRDVNAQYDAVKFYGRQQPNPIYSTILTRTLMDPRYYYGVRVAAAFELAKCAVPQLDYAGQRLLLKVFQELYCFEGSRLPKANNFDDFASYFVQKAIPLALSRVRNQATGKCPREICLFLLDLIRYNENSENVYSDSFYLSTLIESVANTLRPVNIESGEFAVFGTMDPDDWEDADSRQFVSDVVGEIDKCQRLDRWLPSRNHIVTVTALKMDELLVCAGYGEPRMDKLLLATQPDAAAEVRIVATQSLLDLGGYRNDAVVSYVAQTILGDKELVVRSGVLRDIAVLVGNIAINGEYRGAPVDPFKSRQESLARRSVSTAIPLLRSTLESFDAIRTALWDMLGDKRTGTLARRRILELCEVLYEPKARLIVKLKTPPMYELSIKRRRDFMMVAKYRSVLRKRTAGSTEVAAPASPLPEPPRLKLKLGLGPRS